MSQDSINLSSSRWVTYGSLHRALLKICDHTRLRLRLPLFGVIFCIEWIWKACLCSLHVYKCLHEHWEILFLLVVIVNICHMYIWLHYYILLLNTFDIYIKRRVRLIVNYKHLIGDNNCRTLHGAVDEKFIQNLVYDNISQRIIIDTTYSIIKAYIYIILYIQSKISSLVWYIIHLYI